jgi:2-keto-4-pentenoate hydratase/2-oxohepta-3-ene-1,7-dioic acid hydratase in catechol pathway
MRLCRYGDDRLGLVAPAGVHDVTVAFSQLPSWQYPLPAYDPFIANLRRMCQYIHEITYYPPVPLKSVTLRSPVANPGKIVAAPVNYQEHHAEAQRDPQLNQGNPAQVLGIHKAGLFLKANSSLVGPGEGIVLRQPARRTDHEVELAFVIGQRASNVSRADALDYVAGYAIGLDISIRGTEDRSFRKSPDTYTVLGPWLVTADEIDNPGELDLSLTVNGETRQSSNTRHMILGVPELIELASSFYTLHPGDIFLTGTPAGVSPIAAGDRITANIEKIGTMEVEVRGA